jgi:hypothetical protein
LLFGDVMTRCTWALALPFAVSGCIVSAVYKDSVRSQFVSSHYCPSSRVELVELPDLQLRPRVQAMPITGYEPVPEEVAQDPVRSELWEREAAKIRAHDTPPSDVAADPERLAIWNREVAAAHHSDLRLKTFFDGVLRDADLYQVSGCGAQQVFACGAMITKRPCSPINPSATRKRVSPD